MQTQQMLGSVLFQLLLINEKYFNIFEYLGVCFTNISVTMFYSVTS